MIINYDFNDMCTGDKDVTIPTPYFITVTDFDIESTKKFRNEFQKAVRRNQQIIPIIIDSYGGVVGSVFAMIDIIRTAKVPVAIIANGYAYSAGAFLLTAGTPGYRYASPLSSIMIHDASSGVIGKSEDIQNTAERLKDLSGQIFKMLDVNCNKSPGYFKKLIKGARNLELHLSPSEAKDHGMIDHIGIPELIFSVDYKLEIKNNDKD